MSNETKENESDNYSVLDPKDITMVFENLLPPPTDGEMRQLEKNILRDGGIRDRLVIWKNGNKNILVDGINRHRIALKHNLKCPVVYVDFPSIEDVKIFVFTNQLGRRNLSKYNRSELILQLENYYKELGRRNQSIGGKGCQINGKVDTKKILGKQVKVSHDTIRKVKKISENITNPETLKELRQGKRSINSVYNELAGKKSKPEPIPTNLFNEYGGFIPDLSSIKSFTITPSNSGTFKIEVLTKNNEKQVYETVNQIVVTEIKPEPSPSESLPNVPVENVDNSIQESDGETPEIKEESNSRQNTPDENLLHITYQEYDFNTITNPLWEDIRTMFIKDVHRMFRSFRLESGESVENSDFEYRYFSSPILEDVRTKFISSVRKRFKYFSLKMDENCEFPKFCEKLRLELMKNWEEKNQPLGGSRKSESKIISDLRKFKDLDPSSFLISDDSGEETVIKSSCKLTSGINQYFHEMMDTPTQSGKSPMDVIKNSETFMKFMERVIVADGMHLFTKSIEYKNNLKNAA